MAKKKKQESSSPATKPSGSYKINHTFPLTFHRIIFTQQDPSHCFLPYPNPFHCTSLQDQSVFS